MYKKWLLSGEGIVKGDSYFSTTNYNLEIKYSQETTETTECVDNGPADIILIHGFNNSVLSSSMPKYGDADFNEYFQAEAEEYWENYKIMLEQAGHQVFLAKWSSKDRWNKVLEAVTDQLNTEIANGLCEGKCVVITHSAGGPIATRMFNDYPSIANKIDFAIHLGPAFNGAQLAKIAVDAVSTDDCSQEAITNASNFIDNITCETEVNSLGFSNDLIPANMINNNGLAKSDSSENGVAHITNYLVSGNSNGLVSLAIPGEDDEVLSADSTCGSDKIAKYDSCLPDKEYNGKKESGLDAPDSFYKTVYPLIMTKENHSELHDLDDADESVTLIWSIPERFNQVQIDDSSSYNNLHDDDKKTTGDFIMEIFFN
jgi:hypothetical protein